MATIPSGLGLVRCSANLASIIIQVEDHPAFYPHSNMDEAKKLLIGAPPLTYILWKDDPNRRYFLSFMNFSLEIEHRFFTQDSEGLLYKNGDPHRVFDVDQLIPIIMHAKPSQCKMITNPSLAKR